MRTKKNKPNAGIPAIAGSESASQITPNSGNSPDLAGEQKPDRISFNVTEEGAPDWQRMQPKTKEQLTKLLKNKSVQKELGITEETAQALSKLEFGEDEANALLDFIQNINTFGASKVYGIPVEVTSRAFAFSPDHRKKISSPMIRVMNKWAPSFFKTYKDEIGLGVVLFSTINAQIRLMHLLEDQRKRSSGPQPVKKEVTPIAPEPKPAEPVAPVVEDVLDKVGFDI